MYKFGAQLNQAVKDYKMVKWTEIFWCYFFLNMKMRNSMIKKISSRGGIRVVGSILLK